MDADEFAQLQPATPASRFETPSLSIEEIDFLRGREGKPGAAA
jgi:hypothetical protein